MEKVLWSKMVTELLYCKTAKFKPAGHHYKNMPMQYTTEIFFSAVKFEFHHKNFSILNTFAQNIVCGYMLEPSR